MMIKNITARTLDGTPDRCILVKVNESGGEYPIYISAPKFFLLDETAALELADTLVDLVEARRPTPTPGRAVA